MKWKMCGLQLWNGGTEWNENRIERKNVDKNIWAISNVENGFRCCFQQKEQQKIETHKISMVRFFSTTVFSQCYAFVCSSPLLFVTFFSRPLCRTLCNIVIFVSDDVWTTQRQWWWYCSCCCCWCSGATDHHVYTLCVIKFVDCVPTWIQIIHANNGDVHRNGITTFFPASHPYIPHHLFPSFSVFYVLFCAGFPLSLSLSIQWPFAFFPLLLFVGRSKFIWISLTQWMHREWVYRYTDVLLLLFE